MLSSIFWALWRRLWGHGDFKKVISRAIQAIIGMTALTYQLHGSLNIWFTIAVAVWVVLQYWSRAVGAILDAGLNHDQDASLYGRWFRIPLDWVYDKLGKKKYVGFYDFWYASLRHAVGALPLFYYSWLAVFLIPFHYFIYLACIKLFQKYPSLYHNTIATKLTLNEPKNVAEIIHGALFGLIICLIEKGY